MLRKTLDDLLSRDYLVIINRGYLDHRSGLKMSLGRAWKTVIRILILKCISKHYGYRIGFRINYNICTSASCGYLRGYEFKVNLLFVASHTRARVYVDVSALLWTRTEYVLSFVTNDYIFRRNGLLL